MQKTSWGNVAGWYDDLLEKEQKNYQKDLILPNLLRLVDPQKGDKILDVACGQGLFSIEFAKKGADVIGLDIAPELIEIAKSKIKNPSPGGQKSKIEFAVSPADNLKPVASGWADKATIVLAIQNIENLNGTFEECARVLKPGGRLFIVMNHPAYRIPKASSWGWSETEKVQYRRIDKYMSESRSEMQMHPGQKPSEITVSFHRPLQVYFKSLRRAGFAVAGFEEWISNRKSEKGPRAKAEDKARAEIPLFLMMEAVKLVDNSRIKK